jgi:hypothetical protein
LTKRFDFQLKFERLAFFNYFWSKEFLSFILWFFNVMPYF